MLDTNWFGRVKARQNLYVPLKNIHKIRGLSATLPAWLTSPRRSSSTDRPELIRTQFPEMNPTPIIVKIVLLKNPESSWKLQYQISNLNYPRSSQTS